jgi:S-adenosylmethionine:tRNA ribosyltransferase-isomerase
MSADFFDYHLPPEFIAQAPLAERDQSRLLVVRRATQSIEHRIFLELPELLNAGDLLVLNDTRVVPARLVGKRARTGGRWEGLFLRELPNRTWEILSKSRGKLTQGEEIQIEPGPLRLRLLEKTSDGHWRVQPIIEPRTIVSGLQGGDEVGTWQLLQRYGQVPLPPYIRKGQAGPDDRERYQTVYARQAGAVAAPTAGFHFTPRVFERLRERGIDWTFLTLHVGLGTFQPIQGDDITKHVMHREWGELSAEAAQAINACKSRGSKVVAVGTTSARVLETVAVRGARGGVGEGASGRQGDKETRRQGENRDLAVSVSPCLPVSLSSGSSPPLSIEAWQGETDLYIYPPFQFRAVDHLITNFHLPRTTLLLLVSAFAGTDLIRRAYQAAIDERYRFFSYGDAMLIL